MANDPVFDFQIFNAVHLDNISYLTTVFIYFQISVILLRSISPAGAQTTENLTFFSIFKQRFVYRQIYSVCIFTSTSFFPLYHACIMSYGCNKVVTVMFSVIDKCKINNGGCSHTCTNLPDSYKCGCPKGWELFERNGQLNVSVLPGDTGHDPGDYYRFNHSCIRKYNFHVYNANDLEEKYWPPRNDLVFVPIGLWYTLIWFILPWLLLGRLAFVLDGVSKSMADSRPKGPQLRLGHLQVGELQPLFSMYSTRPCCLV